MIFKLYKNLPIVKNIIKNLHVVNINVLFYNLNVKMFIDIYRQVWVYYSHSPKGY